METSVGSGYASPGFGDRQISASEDLIYVSAYTKFQAIRKGGQLHWSVDIDWINTRPLVIDGDAVVCTHNFGTKAHILRFSAKDAARLWEREWIDIKVFHDILLHRNSIVLACESAVTALDPKNGLILWTMDAPAGQQFAFGPISLDDDRMVIRLTDGNIVCLDSNGALQWKTAINRTMSNVHGPSVSKLVVDRNQDIYCGHFNILECFGPDGIHKWRIELPQPHQSAPVVGPRGLIFIGGIRGWLTAVAPN